MRPVEYDELVRARTAFWSEAVGGLAGAVIVHLIASRYSLDEALRLLLVVLFFTCLGTATWSFTTPFKEYLRADWRWRYSEGGPAIQYNIELFISRLTRFCAFPAWISTAAVAVCLLWILTFWDLGRPLAVLREPLHWGWIGCAVLTPLALIFTSRRLREAISLHQAIDEQVVSSGFIPRTDRDAAKEAARDRRPPVEAIGPLEFRAGGYDWAWSDFYKNTAIFGQSGSGKTVCVLNAILDGLLASASAAGQPPAGLILDPKGDFHTKLAMLLRRYGWEERLATIDPGDPQRSMRWNPLDSTDSPIELSGRFAGVLETLSESSDKDKYFIDTGTTFLRHMIAILRAVHPDRPPSLTEIYECASSDNALVSVAKQVLTGSGVEAERAIAFMRQEWTSLAKDTKSVVRSFLSNMLGPFLSEPYDTLFAGRSTVSLGQALDEGRLVYVHLPLAEAEVMARVVSTFVKLEFYREVLRRKDKTRPSFFVCDEFQAFFTVGSGRGDADAFERTRQSNHANIVAFQNLNALYKQTDRKEPVDNLLGNCATQIFLRNTDHATNEYASKLFGEQIESLLGVGDSIAAGQMQGPSSQIGGAAQYGARVREDRFPRLAVPSRTDNIAYAESMTHLGARARLEAKRLRWRIHPISG